DFLKALRDSKQAVADTTVCLPVNEETEAVMLSQFSKAQRRLLLLDYDGTLVNFCNDPADACPDQTLYDLLDRLNDLPNTEIAIISGRGRDSLEQWFGHKNYTLITDHGVWMRKAGKSWKQIEEPRTDWKETIRPVIESFVDRTPGTFIEEKQYSLAWHY